VIERTWTRGVGIIAAIRQETGTQMSPQAGTNLGFQPAAVEDEFAARGKRHPVSAPGLEGRCGDAVMRLPGCLVWDGSHQPAGIRVVGQVENIAVEPLSRLARHTGQPAGRKSGRSRPGCGDQDDAML